MRIASLTGGAVLFIVLLVFSTVHNAAQGGAPQQKVEAAFKNIKALNGTPADQLFPTMQFFEASLGVGCEFCHSGARNEDTPHKAKAREMIAMVRRINNGDFKGARIVTCYTCHRGNAKPVGTPVPSEASYAPWTPDSMNGAPEPAPVPGPPPADVLRKYVQSLGGETALSRITTLTVRYMATDTDGRITNVERVSKGENGLIITRGAIGDPMQYPQATTGWSGKDGWVQTVYGVRDTRDYEVPEAKLQDPLYIAAHWNQVLSAMESSRVHLNGQDVHQVRGKAFGTIPVTLLFNENSGSLLRLSYASETAIGQNLTQIEYSDFRQVQGTRFPFHWNIATSVGYQSTNVVDFVQNTPVEDSRFARPGR